MALVHSIKPDDMDCIYVRQPRALGLGHAVLCAERLVRGEPFAVLLADDLMIGEPPIMQQMTELFTGQQSSILAVQEVDWSETSRYGIVKCEHSRAVDEHLFKIRIPGQLRENTMPHSAP